MTMKMRKDWLTLMDQMDYDGEDDDQEVSDMGDFQQRNSQEYNDLVGQDDENEVSINLQDAIATAE